MASATTVQTALCIIPPETVWKEIQVIREKNDQAYPRWMPHINLVYPFASEKNFEQIKRQLEPFLRPRKPFQILLDSSALHYFQQRGDQCTYHLRPNNATADIVELQKVIQNVLGSSFSKKRPFEAHLTLGQTTTSKIADVLTDLKGHWQTIEFTVDRVYMISRENNPEDLFTIKNEILLLDEQSPTASHLPIKSADVNHLCILIPNEFSSRLLHLLQKTSFRPIKSFRILLAECETGPVHPDLRSKLEAIPKFKLQFTPESLDIDQATSRLFLRPTGMDAIPRLNVLDEEKYDGTLTLGELPPDDFVEVSERLKRSWTSAISELEIDRIHLSDRNERHKFIFRLKTNSSTS